MMHVNWNNTVVTGISGIKIDMPTEAKVSIANVTDELIPSTSAGATASAPPFSFTT